MCQASEHRKDPDDRENKIPQAGPGSRADRETLEEGHRPTVTGFKILPGSGSKIEAPSCSLGTWGISGLSSLT